MDFHSLLQRQLKRASFSGTDLPKDVAPWKTFLKSVSRAYEESDQERRQAERSQEIASKELKTLFELLEESQKIAHLGSWSLSGDKSKIHWSDETFKIFNRDPNLGYPSYEEVFSYIYPEDKEKCEKIVQRGLENGEDFELDFRILVDNKPHWVHFIGRPKFDSVTKKYTFLSGAVVSVDKQKKAEANLNILNKQLIIAARRAGMAEVATSVLHNIGNVMNSVNVSSNSLMDVLQETTLSGLNEVATLLRDHQHDFDKFVTENPQGKNLISYVEKISEFWNSRKIMFLKELNEINRNVKHIKDIISMQQALSGSLGSVEEVSVSSILDDAIKLNKNFFSQGSLSLVFECSNHTSILTDRVKFLQVLVNLIRNAYESIIEHGAKDKNIKIVCEEPDMAHVSIKIIDNGMGVKPENLKKLFSHGFTTKKDGHGFGLHTSAIAARELGGSLTVESEGEGKGCTFELLFPKKPTRRKDDAE